MPGRARPDFVARAGDHSVRSESDLPPEQAALTEPAGLHTHSCEMTMRTSPRYTFGGRTPIRSVLICGAGPRRIAFTQISEERHRIRRAVDRLRAERLPRRLAADYGATVIDAGVSDLIEAVEELTSGERSPIADRSDGPRRAVVKQIPRLSCESRRPCWLYGHGHHGVDLGVLDNIQFIELTMVRRPAPPEASTRTGRSASTANSWN